MIEQHTFEKYVVQGGVPLQGEVTISGAKNSVLKLIAAALLTPHEVVLDNVPQLSDVDVMLAVFKHLGGTVERSGDQLVLNAKDIANTVAPYELVSRMRASFIVLGSLLGRMGHARVSLPGGCSIGKRGVDLHVKGLQTLGAEVTIDHGYVETHAPAAGLIGGEVVLDTPSVGATENIMLAAVLAKGTTIISNAAQEPEILDLAEFLNAIGANITGAGTHDIVIHGVTPSQLRGAHYRVISDRIEAATFLIAGAATYGDVTLHNAPTHGLHAISYKLSQMGAKVDVIDHDSMRIRVESRLAAENIVTQPFPGFPTDVQAPFMALLAICDGVSVITETIYENRFKHVGELKRMGAQIQMEGDVAIVTGVPQLSGAQVKASDLRAGAAMVIASLAADGQSEIYNLHHIDRGYELLDEKLTALGARIDRQPCDEQDVNRMVEEAMS